MEQDPGKTPSGIQRAGSERLFEGRVFAVRRDRLRLAGGGEAVHDVVEHPGAVVIVPVTAAGAVLLVRQYRHAAGEELLELPAGTLEPGEEPLATAARELQEEIGYRPGRLRPLGAFYSAPGFCNELLHCFLAEDLTPSRLQGDPDEAIEVVEMPFAAALAAAREGRFRDAKTVAGLFLATAYRGGEAGGDTG